MSFILYSSVALAWCFEDDRTPAATALLHRVGEAAPMHWPLAALNGLMMAERHKPFDAPRRKQLACVAARTADRAIAKRPSACGRRRSIWPSGSG